jgi:hypothetical protein
MNWASRLSAQPISRRVWRRGHIQEWVSGTNIWSIQIIQLDTVPEPTTLLLFGTTVAGLGLVGANTPRYMEKKPDPICTECGKPILPGVGRD